jgi:hypothetical protein
VALDAEAADVGGLRPAEWIDPQGAPSTIL